MPSVTPFGLKFTSRGLQSGPPPGAAHRANDGQHLVWRSPLCAGRHHPSWRHLGAPVWLGQGAGHKSIVGLFQRFDHPTATRVQTSSYRWLFDTLRLNPITLDVDSTVLTR
jgi:hypothetical protein